MRAVEVLHIMFTTINIGKYCLKYKQYDDLLKPTKTRHFNCDHRTVAEWQND